MPKVESERILSLARRVKVAGFSFDPKGSYFVKRENFNSIVFFLAFLWPGEWKAQLVHDSFYLQERNMKVKSKKQKQLCIWPEEQTDVGSHQAKILYIHGPHGNGLDSWKKGFHVGPSSFITCSIPCQYWQAYKENNLKHFGLSFLTILLNQI